MKLRYGQVAANVADRSIRKRLGNVAAHGVGLRVSCVAYACQETAYFSVISAVNKLAADGLCAKQIQTVILLPPETSEERLRELEDQVRQAALLCHVQVTESHAEVTRAVTRPVVMTTVDGTPFVTTAEGITLAAKVVKPDKAEIFAMPPAIPMSSATTEVPAAASWVQDWEGSGPFTENWHIIVAGAAGMEGTCLLAKEKETQLCGRFPEHFIHAAAGLRKELCVAAAARRICLVTDAANMPIMVSAGEGGIFAALWNLSERCGRELGRHGFDIDLRKLPLRQETIELADFFDINPYEMASEGCLIAVVQNPQAVLKVLEEEEILAVDVGVLAKNNNRCLHNEDEIRFLDAPAPDALCGLLG